VSDAIDRLTAAVSAMDVQTEVRWFPEGTKTAAGTPDSVFPLTPAELLRCSGAEVAAFRESPDG
jgi:hypothetical protein